MHHLHVRHEAHSPKMESKDVTMHVLAHSPYEDPKYLLSLLILASLYDLECNEVLKLVVNSHMSLENVA